MHGGWIRKAVGSREGAVVQEKAAVITDERSTFIHSPFTKDPPSTTEGAEVRRAECLPQKATAWCWGTQ